MSSWNTLSYVILGFMRTWFGSILLRIHYFDDDLKERFITVGIWADLRALLMEH